MSKGTLYIVSTPIGNLDDMTPRAITVLKSVACIAAEDTRHSRRLLDHFGISTPMIPCHDHNERQQQEFLLKKLADGESIALISDAGTPLISDPGFLLVRSAREQEIRVEPVPGACALIAALSGSGLPTDRFFFDGFLPARSTPRIQRLQWLAELPSTWVVYESPHRLRDTLTDLERVVGVERKIVLARELTKRFETFLSGNVESINQTLDQDPNQLRGEFVLLVEGRTEVSGDDEIDRETVALLQRLLEDLPAKKAAAAIADTTKYRKNRLYQLALTLK